MRTEAQGTAETETGIARKEREIWLRKGSGAFERKK
jgi:hypothetical protein